jgi:hypothetical protein
MRGLIALFARIGCSAEKRQEMLKPDQPLVTDSSAQKKKYQGMVVIDNPYAISSDRLEKMNKGGFGGY